MIAVAAFIRESSFRLERVGEGRAGEGFYTLIVACAPREGAAHLQAHDQHLVVHSHPKVGRGDCGGEK